MTASEVVLLSHGSRKRLGTGSGTSGKSSFIRRWRRGRRFNCPKRGKAGWPLFRIRSDGTLQRWGKLQRGGIASHRLAGQPGLLNDGGSTAFQYTNEHSVRCDHQRSLFSEIFCWQSKYGLELIRSNGKAVREDVRLSPLPFIKHGLSLGKPRPAARFPTLEHSLQYSPATTIIGRPPLFLQNPKSHEACESQQNNKNKPVCLHRKLSDSNSWRDCHNRP